MIGDLENLELQLVIWGYAIVGDVTNRDALLVETRPRDTWFESPWDRTARDVTTSVVSVGGRMRPVPLWFCLRWLPQDLMERGIAEMHARPRRVVL